MGFAPSRYRPHAARALTRLPGGPARDGPRFGNMTKPTIANLPLVQAGTLALLVAMIGCQQRTELTEPAQHPGMSPMFRGGQPRVTTGASGGYLGPEPVYQVVPNRSVRPGGVPPTGQITIEEIAR